MTKRAADSANILIARPSGRLLAADKVACEVFAVDPEKLEQATIGDLGGEFAAERWHDLLDQNDNLARQYSMVLTIDGEPENVEVIVRPMRGLPEESLLLTFRIGHSEEREVLHRDALTGLPDRRELQSRFDVLKRARHGQGRSVALVFVDLDQFKQVNDELGHAVGDDVLIALARRWEGCVRDHDLVVRYGGDEFVVLLTDIVAKDAAQPVLDRLAQTTRQPITIRQHQVQISATLGLAIGNATATSLKDLLHQADRDMYAAKESKGRA